MSQLFPQIGGAAGLLTVVLAVIWALFNRRKINAEAAAAMNNAAKIADEAVARRMKSLKDELWEALDLSEQRRAVMTKMDTAIWTMRIRVERHAQWDHEIKAILERLLLAIAEYNIDFSAQVHDPPSLDMSDVDFDFTIHRPAHDG